MITMGVFRFQGKTHMVEPGIEAGISWLVVRSSDHQDSRLVISRRVGKRYYKLVHSFLASPLDGSVWIAVVFDHYLALWVKSRVPSGKEACWTPLMACVFQRRKTSY